MTTLSQYLYISRIHGPRAFESVLGIVRQARANNDRRGVTGLIVFDGERICQYLEGETAQLQPLIESIQADPRHGEIKVLHDGPLEGERRFGRFSMGYLLLDDEKDLNDIGGRGGLEAVRDLLAALPRLDMEP